MQDRSDVTNDAEGEVCSLGVWQTCLQLAMRAAHAPTLALDEFQDELTRAELAEEISEFYALGVQAIFNLANESGFAGDYLAMAELVIGSTTEHTVMTHWRTLQQLVELQGESEGLPALLGRRALTLDDESLAALGVAVQDTLRHASRSSHRRPEADLLDALAPPHPIHLAFSSTPRVPEGSNRPPQTTGDASLLQGTPPSGTTLYPRAQTGT
jgi:hypothetical protein